MKVVPEGGEEKEWGQAGVLEIEATSRGLSGKNPKRGELAADVCGQLKDEWWFQFKEGEQKI